MAIREIKVNVSVNKKFWVNPLIKIISFLYCLKIINEEKVAVISRKIAKYGITVSSTIDVGDEIHA